MKEQISNDETSLFSKKVSRRDMLKTAGDWWGWSCNRRIGPRRDASSI